MRRDVVCFVITLAMALGVTGPAAAAPSLTSPSSDKRNAQAAELFGQGKFREAAELYAQLRDESGNAKYSCNLGLCYSKMGYLDPAIETVRHCLANATLGVTTRSDYEALLAKLEAQRQAPPAEAAPTVPPAVEAPPVVPVPVPVPPPVPPVPAPAAVPEVAPAPAPTWPAPAAPPAAAPYPPQYPAAPQYPAPVQYPAPYYPPAENTPPAAPTTPAPEARAAAVDRGQRRIPFGSYATGAVGLVSTGMGIALVLHSAAIQQELDTSTMADSDRALLESDKSRAKKGATAAFVVGGLGLAASIVWAVVAPSYTKPALGSADMTIAVGPRSVGLAGKF